jgi:hypothetical protein
VKLSTPTSHSFKSYTAGTVALCRCPPRAALVECLNCNYLIHLDRNHTHKHVKPAIYARYPQSSQTPSCRPLHPSLDGMPAMQKHARGLIYP